MLVRVRLGGYARTTAASARASRADEARTTRDDSAPFVAEGELVDEGVEAEAAAPDDDDEAALAAVDAAAAVVVEAEAADEVAVAEDDAAVEAADEASNVTVTPIAAQYCS